MKVGVQTIGDIVYSCHFGYSNPEISYSFSFTFLMRH